MRASLAIVSVNDDKGERVKKDLFAWINFNFFLYCVIFRPDTTLQAIVYKLVPGLYEKELMRKRAFYKDRPEEAALASPEQRGDDTEHLIFSPSDYMSISLEYADTE